MESPQKFRQGQIICTGNYVYRPAGPWTKQVHELLRHLRLQGFLAAPEPIGFDEAGREIVSFIKGDVGNYPLSKAAKSKKALTSAAKLLREYHDASQSFLDSSVFNKDAWQLPSREPFEVICHGDYAPYNVVLKGEQTIGIIDFDASHPAPRVWDIAYTLYRWAPFTNPSNKDGFGSIDNQIKRACLFCDIYELPKEHRRGMASLIITRLQALIDYLFSEAEKGNELCEGYIREGHHLLYASDREYIKLHEAQIEEGLTSEH